jgi:hypothetical protein
MALALINFRHKSIVGKVMNSLETVMHRLQILLLTEQNSVRDTTRFRECLLPFSSESIAFPSAMQEREDRIRKTTNLSVILYGCETWLLILREGRRQKICEQGAEENSWS